MRPTSGGDGTGNGRPAAWWQNASTGQTLAAAVLFSVAIFALVLLFDFFSERAPSLRLIMVLVDAAVATVCGALLFRIARDAQERHRMLMQQLAMIAELNHNVRNALEAIQLSAHTTHNQKLIEDVQAAVMRVQRALREVVPLEDNEPV